MTEQEEYFDDSFEDSFDEDSDSGDFAEYADDGGTADLRSHSDTALGVPSSTVSLPTLRREIQLPPGLSVSPSHHVSSSVSPSHQPAEQDDQSAFSSFLKEQGPKFKKMFTKPNYKKTKKQIGNIRDRIKRKLGKDLTVFGVSLDLAIQRSLLGTDSIELPTVFRLCIDYLEENALDHEGLYRLAGVKSRVEDAKTRFDRGEVVDLSDYDYNAVASLLKLYLRELPEPLIPSKTLTRMESITQSSSSKEQLSIIDDAVEEIPEANKLLLSWLFEHMAHLADKSDINKMHMSNIAIVFCPTLQISAPLFHLIFNNAQEIFGEVEIRKYTKPAVEKRDQQGRNKVSYIQRFEELETEEEITAELDRLTSILDKLHSKMAGKYGERSEHMWEVQRAITVLRRKKKKAAKAAAPLGVQPGCESDFMKTLTLMEATLEAENEELKARKEDLQLAIRREQELIEQYQSELEKCQKGLNGVGPLTTQSDDELLVDDDAELAKQLAALKWHEKELELRNKTLVQDIREEEDEIMQIKVKLKVLPLKQKLSIDE